MTRFEKRFMGRMGQVNGSELVMSIAEGVADFEWIEKEKVNVDN